VRDGDGDDSANGARESDRWRRTFAEDILCDLAAGSASIGPAATFGELLAGTDPSIQPRLVSVWLWAGTNPGEVAMLGPYRPALDGIKRRGDAMAERDRYEANPPLTIEVSETEVRSAASADAFVASTTRPGCSSGG
jgi:hypothetical protein